VRFSLPGALFCALFSALSCMSSCDRSSTPDYDDPPEGTLCSIRELKALCTTDGTVVVRDLSIRGIVTANDHYGEFMRTLVLEEEAGDAIHIAVDRTTLYRLFPFGSVVTVQCTGLALGTYGGVVWLGAAPDAAYGVSRIAASEIGRFLRKEAAEADPSPRTLAFDAVTPDCIGSYVRFEEVRFADEGRWCDLDPETLRPVTTERTIVDGRGRTFVVRTHGTCRYATEPLPAGKGSLCGIVDYFAGRYSLRVTDRRFDFTESATSPTACLSTAGCSAPIPTR